jgi:hypothetical protein
MANKKHHPFSHSVTEWHKDGSSTTHHIHEKHGHKHDVPHRDGDVKHASGDHDAAMDSYMDHTSAPNPGEDKDEANVALPGAAAPGAAVAAPPQA